MVNGDEVKSPAGETIVIRDREGRIVTRERVSAARDFEKSAVEAIKEAPQGEPITVTLEEGEPQRFGGVGEPLEKITIIRQETPGGAGQQIITQQPPAEVEILGAPTPDIRERFEEQRRRQGEFIIDVGERIKGGLEEIRVIPTTPTGEKTLAQTLKESLEPKEIIIREAGEPVTPGFVAKTFTTIESNILKKTVKIAAIDIPKALITVGALGLIGAGRIVQEPTKIIPTPTRIRDLSTKALLAGAFISSELRQTGIDIKQLEKRRKEDKPLRERDVQQLQSVVSKAETTTATIAAAVGFRIAAKEAIKAVSKPQFKVEGKFGDIETAKFAQTTDKGITKIAAGEVKRPFLPFQEQVKEVPKFKFEGLGRLEARVATDISGKGIVRAEQTSLQLAKLQEVARIAKFGEAGLKTEPVFRFPTVLTPVSQRIDIISFPTPTTIKGTSLVQNVITFQLGQQITKVKPLVAPFGLVQIPGKEQIVLGKVGVIPQIIGIEPVKVAPSLLALDVGLGAAALTNLDRNIAKTQQELITDSRQIASISPAFKEIERIKEPIIPIQQFRQIGKPEQPIIPKLEQLQAPEQELRLVPEITTIQKPTTRTPVVPGFAPIPTRTAFPLGFRFPDERKAKKRRRKRDIGEEAFLTPRFDVDKFLKGIL